MSQVTLSTSSFFPDTEFAFQVAADLGYDGVEVMVSHDRKSQTIESVRELSEKYNTPIHSVHVPCLAISQHVWGWNPELKLNRSIDMAKAVGAEVVVVHPPFRWQREYGIKFVELITKLNSDPTSPRIAVENMYDVDALGKRVNPYLCNTDQTFPEFDFVTLDTSHAAASRSDPVDMAEQIGDRLCHIHLSDSTGTKGDEHLPPGTGDLPLGELINKTVGAGYKGQIVLEVAFQRLPEPERVGAADLALQWTRKLIKGASK